MKRFPRASTVTALGLKSDASVAGPPSPEKPAFPLPTTVVITNLANMRHEMLKAVAQNLRS